jgi:hypothetical protein
MPCIKLKMFLYRYISHTLHLYAIRLFIYKSTLFLSAVYYLSIHLSIYGSEVLCWFLAVFSFLILYTVGGRGSRKAATYTRDITNTE